MRADEPRRSFFDEIAWTSCGFAASVAEIRSMIYRPLPQQRSDSNLLYIGVLEKLEEIVS